jgi:hypothetical protein
VFFIAIEVVSHFKVAVTTEEIEAPPRGQAYAQCKPREDIPEADAFDQSAGFIDLGCFLYFGDGHSAGGQ